MSMFSLDRTSFNRGSEFCDAEEFEKEENESRRTRIFYCDPMASG